MKQAPKKIIKNKEERIMKRKNFLGKGNRKIVAVALAMAMALSSGMGVLPQQVQQAQAAIYADVTYSNIPSRKVDITDGQATEMIDGVGDFVLTPAVTTKDAEHDVNGVVWIRHLNGALGCGSYELEGKSMVYHKYYEPGSNKQARATEFLFLGENKKYVTHYKDQNGTIIPLPDLDYLRKLWGIAAPATPSPSSTPTMTVPPMPTATPTPVVTPTPTPVVTPTPTPVVTPTPTPVVTPTPTPVVTPTPTPVVTPTPTPVVIPTPTPIVTPTPTPVVTPTPTPVVTPTPTPNVIIDSDINMTTEEKNWLNMLINGKMSWQEFVKNITNSNWKIEKDDHEVRQIWYVYDDAGKLVYQYEDTSGHSTEIGNGNKEETGNTTGDANVEIKDKEEGGSNTNTNISGTTTITDNRPTGGNSSTAKKGTDHIKQSGGRYEWISADGGTKLEFTVKNGKFKYLTLNGKKVKAATVVKKNKVIMLRIAGGKTCAISINSHKIAWLKEKTRSFCRDKNGFGIRMILKSGKKVSIKNLKVSKGKYGTNIHKIKYTVSYKKLK